MTKIIAGAWKGRTLRVPESVTRPTASRVREAMFSSLEHHIGRFDGLKVLDLYAGSGGLGFESLSRGAVSVVLVDSDRKAVEAMKSNSIGLAGDIQIRKFNVGTFVAMPSAGQTFDVVFLDPPYSVVDAVIEEQLLALATNGWLAPGATLVVERDKKSVVSWPEGFEGTEPRPYGDTMVWYGTWSGN